MPTTYDAPPFNTLYLDRYILQKGYNEAIIICIWLERLDAEVI